MKKFQIAILFLLVGCSKTETETSHKNEDPEFVANTNLTDIDKSILYTVSECDFSVIFYLRDNSNHGWYKMFSRRLNYWEKIEIQQTILDKDQMRKDQDYYISRDITTRKLCKPEEAASFLNKLRAYKVFELPEEDVFFKNCRDSQITDLGYTYIIIVSGNEVRKLTYPGIYECSKGEWESLRKIEDLFEKEWFENTLCQ